MTERQVPDQRGERAARLITGGHECGCGATVDTEIASMLGREHLDGVDEALRASRFLLVQACGGQNAGSDPSPERLAGRGKDIVSVLEALENLAGALAHQVQGCSRRNPAQIADQLAEIAVDRLSELRQALSVAAFHAHVYTAAINQAYIERNGAGD